MVLTCSLWTLNLHSSLCNLIYRWLHLYLALGCSVSSCEGTVCPCCLTNADRLHVQYWGLITESEGEQAARETQKIRRREGKKKTSKQPCAAVTRSADSYSELWSGLCWPSSEASSSHWVTASSRIRWRRYGALFHPGLFYLFFLLCLLRSRWRETRGEESDLRGWLCSHESPEEHFPPDFFFF